MTAPSAPVPAPRPDERQFLQALTSDPEQRVIGSVVSRLASWRRADRARPWVRRWGVPVFCFAGGSDAYLNPHNVGNPQLPLVLAFCIPLLWRERRPMLVFALTTAVSVVSLSLGVLTGAEFARVVALFNVGRHCTPRQLAVATGVTLVQLVAWAYFFWRGQQLEYVTRPEPVTLMVMVAVVAFAALGLLLRLAYAYIDALKKQRDQQARLATAQERARVSREMHDILGHTLAVIVGLADGAAALTESKPERGAQTLRIISASGRDALAELRRLLAVIGDDRECQGRSHDVPLAPQPSLADLDALLDRVRAAGPTVALHAHDDLTGLAPGLQLSAYRVIQEALTNTVKYAASDTSVHVSIAANPDTVRLTVEDTGPPRTPRARRGRTGSGRGLVGMRERAALYRGEVTAGPNPHGGWTVHATLIPNPPVNSLEKDPA
ncbi:sensor histidine kinase [Streptomyces sporangiiformans]|uniref:histidine kinase n=1 Tax=Streptomyces sporangiiformans TaxID=2315329 RepID=A0A505D6B2_9ACTN|nr:histidine kinase [Streptomyces sporangiiformans]TPQ18367.1 two-component sensor histidine kinase [Streptomyces sporangiiformans]